MNLTSLWEKWHEKARHYRNLQDARATRHESLHPTIKVGAVLVLADGETISSSNVWLDDLIPPDSKQKIGNGSPSVHAEVSTIFRAIKQGKSTQGAKMYISDPPCPSCVKAMVEAGIKEIYFDRKGLDNPWYEANRHDFKRMSLELAGGLDIPIYIGTRNHTKERAAIEPYNKDALAKRTMPFNYGQKQYLRPVRQKWTNPLAHEQEVRNHFGEETPFAMAIAVNPKGEGRIIIATSESPVLPRCINYDSKKYSEIMHPLDRLLMVCARHGVKPLPNSIVCSGIPVADELVNLCGFAPRGENITIIDPDSGDQKHGLEALRFLEKEKALFGLLPDYENNKPETRWLYRKADVPADLTPS